MKPKFDVPSILARVKRPSRMVVTAGMPYANGPLHLGHLAGAHLPADIYARYMGMVIGRDKVLYVCGSDDHGSTSELAAVQAGRPIREFIDEIHDQQTRTMKRYSIGLDIYTGTSQPDCFPINTEVCQDFLTRLHKNGLLRKRTSRQWYDPEMERFLPDRYVRGQCPNEKCGNPDAYSDECDLCGHQHDPSELINPRSRISEAVPVMKETVHWWLDMWSASELLREWIQGKRSTWRKPIITEVCAVSVADLNRTVGEEQHAIAALEFHLGFIVVGPRHAAQGKSGAIQTLVVAAFADQDWGRVAGAGETQRALFQVEDAASRRCEGAPVFHQASESVVHRLCEHRRIHDQVAFVLPQ